MWELLVALHPEVVVTALRLEAVVVVLRRVVVAVLQPAVVGVVLPVAAKADLRAVARVVRPVVVAVVLPPVRNRVVGNQVVGQVAQIQAVWHRAVGSRVACSQAVGSVRRGQALLHLALPVPQTPPARSVHLARVPPRSAPIVLPVRMDLAAVRVHQTLVLLVHHHHHLPHALAAPAPVQQQRALALLPARTAPPARLPHRVVRQELAKIQFGTQTGRSIMSSAALFLADSVKHGGIL